MDQKVDHYMCPRCEVVTDWRKSSRMKGEGSVECVKCGFESTLAFLKSNEVIPKDFEKPTVTEQIQSPTYPTQEEVERRLEKVNKLEIEKEKDEIGWNLFTAAMQRRLSTKRMEGKHGWWDGKLRPTNVLLNKLEDASAEVRGRFVNNKGTESVMKELVDVGNYAMMLYNRLRGSVKNTEEKL